MMDAIASSIRSLTSVNSFGEWSLRTAKFEIERGVEIVPQHLCRTRFTQLSATKPTQWRLSTSRRVSGQKRSTVDRTNVDGEHDPTSIKDTFSAPRAA